MTNAKVYQGFYNDKKVEEHLSNCTPVKMEHLLFALFFKCFGDLFFWLRSSQLPGLD